MSVHEVVAELGINRVTVYKWLKAGRLDAEPDHPYKRRQGKRITRASVMAVKAGER